MKRIIMVITALIVFLQVSVMLYGAIPASERAALIAFYNATNGDDWTRNANWKGNNNEADGFSAIGTEETWYGLTVTNDHVTRIEMTGNRLTRSIPVELGNLGNLDSLYLGRNQLSGSIPAELGNLSELKRLYLYSNQLSGSIPGELGNLSNLYSLELYLLSTNYCWTL